ncbi:MAG: hypothetical protein K2Y23_22670 [Cyanobacteria bacterium]|nr:hypothetical protein [Cyanobacteriota bacterium]
MRARTLAVVVVAVVVAFASPAYAQNPVGVWKMNPAKSKYSPGPAPKSSTVTTTAVAGGGFRSVNETVPATGAATKTDVTFKLDGKDNKITGNVNADTQAYTRVDDRHYTITAKKAGKVTLTTKIELAADGKSRTSTQTGTDAQGKAVNNFIFYDKQ